MFVLGYRFICFFFFKQKTAYEMRISDWSSDVCSSDLLEVEALGPVHASGARHVPRVALVLQALEQLVELGGEVGLHQQLVAPHVHDVEIGRASCRERVCQYVSLSLVAVSLKKK